MTPVAIELPVDTWELLLDVFQQAYQLEASPPMGWDESDRRRQKKVMFDSMAEVGRQAGKDTRKLSVNGWLIVWDEVDRLGRWKNLKSAARAAVCAFNGAVNGSEEMQPILRLVRQVKQAESAVLSVKQEVSAAQEAVAKVRKAVYLDGAEEVEEGEEEEELRSASS